MLTRSSPLASTESAHATISAQILELDPSGTANHALSEGIHSGARSGLREGLSHLSDAALRALQQRWGDTLPEITALSEENDPRIFQEGLLALGARLEGQDRLEEAGAVYNAVVASGGINADRAQARLDAITGVGAAGARLEFLGRRLVREATRPEMLLAMGVAGATFRLTRLAATARLGASLRNAWALRGAANTLGFLAETAAFTGTAKLAGAGFGVPQDWSGQALFREWAGGATMLLGLRAMGGLSQAALRRWAQGGGAMQVFTRAALPQAAMLGGIFLGHHAEEWAGWRRPQANATTWIDSLATLIQFNVGARLLHSATGGQLSVWERGLDIQNEAMLRSRNEGNRPGSFGMPWLAALGGRSPMTAGGPPIEGVFMMGNDGNEGTGGPTVSGTHDGASPRPILAEAAVSSTVSTEAELRPNPKAPVAEEETPAPETPPPPFDLRETRYHLPNTKYFNRQAGSLTFEQLVGYAQSETRVGIIGTNLRNSLSVPLDGPLEYSPYGAGLVERLRENPAAVHTLTGKWDRALVASPGTAILGLGSAAISADHVLQAEAADAIMQGKAKFFLWTAGVSATPLCVRSYFSPAQLRELETMEPRRREEQARIWRAERFAETVHSLAPGFGFINVEDAQGKDLPLIFGVLESLRGDTAIWSDDKQGTGVITAAAMLSWAELTQRLDSRQQMSGARGIIFGAGAGAMGVYDELVHHGIRPENILVTDSQGALHAGRGDIESDPYKVRMREGIPAGTTVEDFARGADFLINLGAQETFTDNPSWTADRIRSLGPNPFVAPMTNPEPGVTPESLRAIRPDAFYGSGNQVHENPVNNFTAFGYIGAGAMMARAGAVSPAMTIAAARGIFEVAKMGPPEQVMGRLPAEQREFGRHWLVPRPDDIRLISLEAGAVARAAARDGLAILLGANPGPAELARFDREIDEQVRFRQWFVANMREELRAQSGAYLAQRHPARYAPFAAGTQRSGSYEVAPEIRREHFEYFARQIGIRPEHWQNLLTPEGALVPTALSRVLRHLQLGTVGDGPQNRFAARELGLITQISAISPSLGLALGLRRSMGYGFGIVRQEFLWPQPTVFHREEVLRTVLQVIPEVRAPLQEAFSNLPETP